MPRRPCGSGWRCPVPDDIARIAAGLARPVIREYETGEDDDRA